VTKIGSWVTLRDGCGPFPGYTDQPVQVVAHEDGRALCRMNGIQGAWLVTNEPGLLPGEQGWWVHPQDLRPATPEEAAAYQLIASQAGGL
jgi:hypothetical protein